MKNIPFPGLEKLIAISYPKLLSLFILLPFVLKFSKINDKKIFSEQQDRYIIFYFMYIFFMGFRDTTLTNAFRGGFNMFVDIYMLYFVASRIASSKDDYEKIFNAMMFTAVILVLIAIFETSKGWHLYSSLPNALESVGRRTVLYRSRLGILRSYASFENPLPFGLYLASMIGAVLFLRYTMYRHKKALMNLLIWLILMGVCATLSRGPLVSVVIFFAIFFMFAKQKALKMLPILIVMFFAFLLSPLSDVILSTLPFVGKKAQGTLNYRKELWSNSIEVIQRSPLTGHNKYFEEPEIESLRRLGGNTVGGYVDIVNAYLSITLRYGLIGVSLFVLMSFIVLKRLFKSLRYTKEEDMLVLGQILFSVIFTLMITIASASMISYLPTYFWCFIGLSVGYTRIVMKKIYHDK